MEKNVLKELKSVNAKRSAEAFGMDISELSPSDWAIAVAGETGELCNLIHKAKRGDYRIDDPEVVKEIGKEAADIVIYLDLLCQRVGLDLGKAIVDKFNEVSHRRNCSITI